MATISGHSLNIGPYGKNVFKIFPLKPVSQFNSKQTWHGWSLNGQLSKLSPVTQTSIQDGCHQRT
jgi:hypothetical protein